MAVIASTGVSRALSNAGAPGAGTDEIQTLTFGGTPTGGTFKISFQGQTTANITWSSTNATLVANIDAALEALSTIGTSNVTTAVGTMTAGIGTITCTFVAGMGKLAVPTMTVAQNAMTGTSPTLAIAETTPGVDATSRGAPKGSLLVDTTNAKLYINTGTTTAPTWTVVGSQS
jgi:hypothetical protein